MTTDITELAQREKFEAWWEREYKHLESSKYTDAVPHIKYGFWMAYQAGGAELVEALEKAQTKAIEQGRTACELFDEVTALRQRISELESRTVKLPAPYAYLRESDGQIQISIGAERPSDRSGGYATPWFAIYTADGIKVEAE